MTGCVLASSSRSDATMHMSIQLSISLRSKEWTASFQKSSPKTCLGLLLTRLWICCWKSCCEEPPYRFVSRCSTLVRVGVRVRVRVRVRVKVRVRVWVRVRDLLLDADCLAHRVQALEDVLGAALPDLVVHLLAQLARGAAEHDRARDPRCDLRLLLEGSALVSIGKLGGELLEHILLALQVGRAAQLVEEICELASVTDLLCDAAGGRRLAEE